MNRTQFFKQAFTTGVLGALATAAFGVKSKPEPKIIATNSIKFNAPDGKEYYVAVVDPTQLEEIPYKGHKTPENQYYKTFKFKE